MCLGTKEVSLVVEAGTGSKQLPGVERLPCGVKLLENLEEVVRTSGLVEAQYPLLSPNRVEPHV